jgi:cellulose synthase/poly-beta-1,6-N-acetylglucosamine synthase-like glycosyltransferase
MALTLKIVLWACVGAVAYNYAGYPIVLYCCGLLAQAKSDLKFLITKRNRRCLRRSAFQPSVAIIVSAFNEEGVIEARVRNLLEVSYPPNLIEILIGLDSPTDTTPQILNQVQSPRVHVFHFSIRRGKLAVISDLAQQTEAEILVFTDANTMFEPDSVSNLIRHFADREVAAVSGEEIRLPTADTDPGGESLYWRYESALNVLESRLHCLHSANGGIYAIRRALFRPRPNLIDEDFQIPLELRFRGHRIVYDPEAVAVEEIAPTFSSQFERRSRLGAGNFQALFDHPGYLNPFKGLPAFAYWSHRVLRWLTSFLLIIAFACSMRLTFRPFYRGLFIVQCAFYGLAALGYWRKKQGKSVGVCRIPLYFCLMNAAQLFGLIRYVSGRQSVAWVATPRQATGEVLPSRSHEG